MVRRPFFYNLSLAVAAVVLAISVYVWPSVAANLIALTFAAALIVVAFAPVSPVRSFLRRIAARTRDPVPSTI